MLDSFIIQRIQEEEEEERRRRSSQRPGLEIPMPDGPEPARTDESEPTTLPRGVVIIEPDET